jgi:drug/metabolite transporter (DMT)-like permease
VWVVASAASYSLFAVFSKWVLDDLSPTDLLFWRFVVAVPVAWSIVAVRARRGGPGPGAAPARQFLPAGLVFGLLALFAFVGLDHLSASLYTVIIYTYPAMVAVGATLLGRRPPRALWAALGITTLGIALTVPEVFRGGADADGLGLVLTLMNAAVYAGYVLVTGALVGADDTATKGPGELASDVRGGAGSSRPPADGIVGSAWSLTGSLAFAVVVAVIVGVSVPTDPAVIAGVLGLGVVSTVVASMTLFVGMRTVPPATAALIATLEPVLTLTWAVTLLDESLVPLQIAGAVLVLAGVVWAQRITPATAPLAAEPVAAVAD